MILISQLFIKMLFTFFFLQERESSCTLQARLHSKFLWNYSHYAFFARRVEPQQSWSAARQKDFHRLLLVCLAWIRHCTQLHQQPLRCCMQSTNQAICRNDHKTDSIQFHTYSIPSEWHSRSSHDLTEYLHIRWLAVQLKRTQKGACLVILPPSRVQTSRSWNTD